MTLDEQSGDVIDYAFFRFSEFLQRRRPSLTVIFFRISASYGHDKDRATHLFPDNPSHINDW